MSEKSSLARVSTQDDKGKGEIPDVRAIMAEIRARVKADLANRKDSAPAFAGMQADQNARATRKAGELLHSEDLRYLNQHYAFAPRLDLDSVTSHRPGIIGKLIVKGKRKLLSIVWDLLKGYFQAERDYQAALVRFLNDTSKYVDARDAGNFWELIRKLDYDITKALDRIERIHDEQMASLRSTERNIFDNLGSDLRTLNERITKIQAQLAAQQDGLKTQGSVVSGLESILARAGKNSAVVEAVGDAQASIKTDYSYLLLENRFRGSEAEISQRLAIYPELFRGAKKPVLEIGGGRGELQSLFKSQGISSYCVDMDRAMVEASVGRGLDAKLGDGIAHLRSLANGSLGGVIAIQVVEHLPRPILEELFVLARQKVVPGGKIIFETINPRSVLALSSNYFRDPTHIWPLHPDTLAYAMELSGLEVKDIRFLSPVPAEAQLRPLPIESHMTPRWADTLERLNTNISQLNDLLYGFQDYCVIAEVRQN